MPGTDDFVYKLIERAVSERWTVVDFERAAIGAGVTAEALKAKIAEIVANPAGRSQMASMAKTLLARMAAAEGAAVVGAAAAGGAGAGGGGAAGGTFLGLSVGAWFFIGVVVLAGGAYYVYSTSSSSRPVPSQSASSSPSSPQPSPRTCTRGVVVPEEGSAVRVAYNKPTYTFAYTDPASRVSNQIQWNIPPENINIGEKITLVSWSTHNQGAPVYVEWEVNGDKAPGALSDRKEPDPHRLEITYRGGPVKLIGGKQLGGIDTTFKMQWPYTCR